MTLLETYEQNGVSKRIYDFGERVLASLRGRFEEIDRMAELNQGNQTMKAVSGHRKDEEVARYTEAANQRSMADDAIGVLARWEMSNRAERLDTHTAKNG
jgi:hypothetical protein